MNIKIENLPLSTTDADLKELFSAYGEVTVSELCIQSYRRLPALTGVVKMSRSQGINALDGLAGFRFAQRVISMNEKSDESGAN
ncbi:MAG: hypothetical protein ACU84Q_12620 [Gammaproteobacteria bacterium]